MGPDRPDEFEPPEILQIPPTVVGGDPIEEKFLKRLGYGKKIDTPRHIRALSSSAIKQVLASIEPKAIVAFTPISSISKDAIHACGVSVESPLWADLARRSGHPITMAVLALTLGPLPDQDIAYEKTMNLTDRFMLHEAAALVVELLADDLSERLENHKRVQGLHPLHRFSPGYCDIPLAVQAAFFHFLNPPLIGIRLCDSGAMIPSKSLTAAILFAPDPPALSPCPQCDRQGCRHRRN
ncbi:MAG: hypothetical protein HY911_13185 [Desulfobacterales bacterium]|nr:hypothetical protein [Desulfobacterales bacterium]